MSYSNSSPFQGPGRSTVHSQYMCKPLNPKQKKNLTRSPLIFPCIEVVSEQAGTMATTWSGICLGGKHVVERCSDFLPLYPDTTQFKHPQALGENICYATQDHLLDKSLLTKAVCGGVSLWGNSKELLQFTSPLCQQHLSQQKLIQAAIKTT